MPSEVELIARAERAERRLAELQKVLRQTDRDQVFEALERAREQVARLSQANRRHRLWMRRSYAFDRYLWLVFGINFGFLFRMLIG